MTDLLAHLAEDLIQPHAITAGTIFISYSRKNRDFARALYEKMERMGFTLWQDVHDIDAGADDWWQSILAGIHGCKTLILCMSLPALKSPVVGDEWFEARRAGKRIIPIVADEIWEHPEVKSGKFTIPNWMRMKRQNWLDIRASSPDRIGAWANLIRTLNESYTPKRYISMVDELPPRFVRRPDDMDRIIRALVDDNHDAIAMTTALRGAGGYGKTTLAKAIARDVRIQGAFDDGVLWVTLGEELLQKHGEALKLALVSKIQDLIFALTDKRPAVESLELAKTLLHEAIGDLSILLVVDDVWDESHLAPFMLKRQNKAEVDDKVLAQRHLTPFLVKSNRASCLITTRNADTVKRDDIHEQSVDKMTPIEAVELLSAGIDPETLAPHRARLTQLARSLREYPLLLALANTQITSLIEDMKLSLGEAIDYVREILDEQGVLGFDDTSTDDRTRAVDASLGISLNQLNPDEKRRYLELAIFREDALIPLSTLQSYWGMSKIATLQFCQRLYRKTALLHSFEGNTVRIHDVFRDYLIHQWTDAELQALHVHLITGWGDFKHLPDDYAWRYVGYHLKEGGQLNILRGLLLDFDFLSAKLQATDTNALIADCDLITDDEPVGLVGHALSLSAHVLANHHEQLDNQLLGRLNLHQDKDGISGLYRQTYGHAPDEPRLKLISPTLQPAGGALIRTLEGHTNWVSSVALADDFAVSSSIDRTLRVWNWQTGEHIRTLNGHTNGVTSVALAGEFAVSASWDHTLRVWNWQTGKYIHTLEGHTSIVNSVAVAGDFAVSASGHPGSQDKTLRVWNWRTGKHIRTLEGHTDDVTGVALDGEFAFSVSMDNTIRVWNWMTGEYIHTLEEHSSGVVLAGDFAVSASWYGTLPVWNWRTGKRIRTLVAHARIVNSVALDGELVVSASRDNTLQVWNWTKDQHIRTLAGHKEPVTSVALSGKFAVSTSRDNTLRVWDLTKDTIDDESEGHNGRVNSVTLTENFAVSASKDKMLLVWDWSTGKYIRTLKGHTSIVNSVALVGDFAVSASGDIFNQDHTLRVWNWTTGKHIHTLEGHTHAVNNVALAGNFAISASGDHTLGIWDWQTGEHLHTLEGHTGGINSVALAGDFAVSASGDIFTQDHTLRVWNWRVGEHIQTLKGHTGDVNSIALAGDYAVSASEDKTLRVWNWQTGKHIRTLEGHISGVISVALSREVVISASWDQTLRVCNWTTGQHIQTLYTDSTQRAVAIDPDGKIVVSGGSDGKVHFWKPNETLRRMLRGG